MDDQDTQDIIAALKDVVAKVTPELRYVPKYGGEVLAHIPGDDAKFVGGIFTYKTHVSLEFSNGAAFDDPDGVLAGKGKKRRHLTFETVGDVARYDVASFLQQAVA